MYVYLKMCMYMEMDMDMCQLHDHPAGDKKRWGRGLCGSGALAGLRIDFALISGFALIS